MNNEYKFSNQWFDTHAKRVWDSLIPQINPTRILEIGSYEGASACYLIEKQALDKDVEIFCIDTWEGGVEHSAIDMNEVENRFIHNTNVACGKVDNKAKLTKIKGFSDQELCKLIANNKIGYFDFIYIDGSHQAFDVLSDAILSFKLLKINGFMVFDDYLWQEPLEYGVDPLRCPKPAIDAFTNIFCRKIKLINAPIYQIFLQKISE